MNSQVSFGGYIGSFDGNFRQDNFSVYFPDVTLQEGLIFIFDHDAYNEKVIKRKPDNNSGQQNFRCGFYTGDLLLVTKYNQITKAIEYKRIPSEHNEHLHYIGAITTIEELTTIVSEDVLSYGTSFLVGIKSDSDLAVLKQTLNITDVSYLDLVTVGGIGDQKNYKVTHLGRFLDSKIENTIINSKNIVHFKQLNSDSIDTLSALEKNYFYHIAPSSSDYVEYNGKFYEDLKIFVDKSGLIDVLNAVTPYTKITEGYLPKSGSGKYSNVPVDSNVYESEDQLFVPEDIIQFSRHKALRNVLHGVFQLVEGTSAGDNEIFDVGLEFKMLDTFSPERYSTYKLIAPSPELSKIYNAFSDGSVKITLPTVTSTIVGKNNLTPTRFTKVSSNPDIIEDSLLTERGEILSYLGKGFELTELLLKSPQGQTAIISNSMNSNGSFSLPEEGGVLATHEIVSSIFGAGTDLFLPMFLGTTASGMKKLVNSPLMKSTVVENGTNETMVVTVNEEGMPSGGIGTKFIRTSKISITSGRLLDLDNDTVSILPTRDNNYRMYDANGNHVEHKRREITMPHWNGEIVTSEGPIDGGNY